MCRGVSVALYAVSVLRRRFMMVNSPPGELINNKVDSSSC